MMDYWKATAVARLMEYDAMEKAAENLPAELQLCRVAGEGDARLNAVVRKKELRARLRTARQQLAQTNKALGALTPQEQLVLRLLYIAPQKGNVEKLCNLLACEQATVYRRRDRALRKFAMALYGKNEDYLLQ